MRSFLPSIRWTLGGALVAVLVNICLVSAGYSGEYNPHYDDYGGEGYHHQNVIVPVKKVVDYYAKPKYAFGYEVDDYYNQLSHGRWEIRDGDVTQGQYRVLLPDGRIQIVSYIADKFGYRPTIEYINKGAHPPPPPAYAHVKIPHYVNPEPFPLIGPSPIPVSEVKSPYGPIAIEPYPLKIRVNPVAVGPLIPQHHYPQYGPSFGYGFDPFLAAGSTNSAAAGSSRQQRLSSSKVARKRALLYDRTLFRKDVEKRVEKRSNVNGNGRNVRRVLKRVKVSQPESTNATKVFIQKE